MGAWIAYVWMSCWAGLAIHPYQSVKRMVMGDKILLPVTLSPVLLLLLLLLVGRVGSHFFTLAGWGREGMAFLLGSTLIGLLLWQGLLLALVYRFWRVK